MSTLKERLVEAMKGPPPIRAAALARACGVKQPSVSDWLSGRTKNLEGANLLNAAKALNVSPEWLASGKGPMRLLPSSDVLQESSTEKSYPSEKGEVMHLRVATRRTSQDDDVVLIPRLDVKAKGGLGALAPANEFVIGSMSVTNSWIHQKLPRVSAKANLAVIEAYGTSMKPTIMSGDLLLVDMGVTDVKVEGIYILLRMNTPEPEIMVKRIQRKLDGGLIVKSDNRDEVDPETVEAYEIAEKIRVVGKVVWIWAGREA